MQTHVKLATRSLNLLCLFSLLSTANLSLLIPIVNAQTPILTENSQTQAPQRQRVAVLDFDFADTGSVNFANIFGGASPAQGVSNLIANALAVSYTHL
ncbi:penicillin-binding protein activator LpoB, partial [Chroococcidiopsis cubana CCALA 043]